MQPNDPELSDTMYRFYAGQTPGGVGSDISNASGNKAAAAANAVLTPATGQFAYMTGFDVTGGGATAASEVLVTVTGLLVGTLTYVLNVPAGVTPTFNPALNIRFPYPMIASAISSAITVNVPSFGSGNTNAATVAYGFQTLK
jgi:hypothetical protein